MSRYKNPDDVEVGTRLRDARIDAGLSCKQAAAQLGLCYEYARRLEVGECSLTKGLAIEFAILYGVSAHWLYSGQHRDLTEFMPLLEKLSPLVRLRLEKLLKMLPVDCMSTVASLGPVPGLVLRHPRFESHED